MYFNTHVTMVTNVIIRTITTNVTHTDTTKQHIGKMSAVYYMIICGSGTDSAIDLCGRILPPLM
uniref:Uncharacterized protein n=1 Tax=Arion vulgaris TaxID=1028688 RepID=A0A0B6ZPJ9_9EUPU